MHAKRIILMVVVLSALLGTAWFAVTNEPPPSVIQLLVARLDDADATVRTRAAGELRKLGRRAMPELLAILKPPAEPDDYRTRLRRFLPEAFQPVVMNRRAQVLHAFEILGPDAEDIIPLMISGLDGRPFPQRPANVLIAVGPAAVSPVCRALQTSTNVNLQAQLIRILGDIGTNAGGAIPEMLARVADGNADVRAEVAAALGKIHAEPDEAIPSLQKLLHDEAAPVRAQAAGALGEFGPAAAAATLELLEATADSSAPVRLAALNAVLRFEDPRAAGIAARQLAEDSDPKIRAAAESALNHAAHPRKD